MCSDFGRRRFGRAKIPYLILLAVSCFRVSSVSGNVNCSYLSAGPGIGPLERDVGAAVSGAASELVVGALGIKGSDDLYNQWNATFSQ